MAQNALMLQRTADEKVTRLNVFRAGEHYAERDTLERMSSWRRQFSRHYSRRDLKCFLVMLMLLVVTMICLIIRSQHRYQDGDDFDTDILELSQGQRSGVEKYVRENFLLPPSLVSGGPPTTWADVSTLEDFRSPYITSSSLLKEFKLPRDVKKNATQTKLITWYAPASAVLHEDLFDDDAFDKCPVRRCRFLRPEVVGDKQVDAVVFPGVAGRDKDPPARSHPNQVFIYHDMDPPIKSPRAFGGDVWNSIFNWTWSYRRDADIWEPRGSLKYDGDSNSAGKTISYFRDVARSKSRNRPAAWFVSACHVSSQRELYVQQMQQHLRVDVYGTCGNLTCQKSFACLEMLSKKYFFYLSFESALCRDFVTEKFFHMFFKGVHVVPVVLGGADYRTFFPDGTYIDADWFESPADLAAYLNRLIEDREDYAEYLLRKSFFVYEESGRDAALCQLCQRLHQLDDNRKAISDLQAWYRNDQCRAPRPL